MPHTNSGGEGGDGGTGEAQHRAAAKKTARNARLNADTAEIKAFDKRTGKTTLPPMARGGNANSPFSVATRNARAANTAFAAGTAKKAASLKKNTAMRTVNPSSKKRRSLVTTGDIKTVKRKNLSNVQRAAGAGIQVAK